jgi:uncharacterized phage protein (predicted DNA packaging)
MLDLQRIKAHLRVEHTDEDGLIDGYKAAALVYIEQHCDRKIVDAPSTPSEMALTSDLEQAALLLIGHWYTSREAVVVGVIAATVPLAVDSLLWTRRAFA